jgi:aryl-alcohol dehydrogenase-like predicted oxidoreductase
MKTARPKPIPPSFAGSRREFLQTLLAVTAFAPEVRAMQKSGPAGLPLRPLGQTGVSLPIVGLGGWDSVANKSDAEGIALMHEALDSGVTFFDNCWEYHDGRAEDVMGRALQSAGRRDQVFLMTKVCARDEAGFRKHFDDSLRRLRTDHVDLLLFHALQYPGDRERICDPQGGALKAALAARQAGKVRFLGFSGHMYPEVHLGMLEEPQAWDAVLMPVNVLDAHYRSFEKSVLPACRARGIGALGMKSLCAQDGRLPREAGISWELCRRYALSLPITALVCGIQTREQLRGLLRVVRGFEPLAPADVESVLKTAAAPARHGRIEAYKDPASGFGCKHHSALLKAADAGASAALPAGPPALSARG